MKKPTSKKIRVEEFGKQKSQWAAGRWYMLCEESRPPVQPRHRDVWNFIERAPIGSGRGSLLRGARSAWRPCEVARSVRAPRGGQPKNAQPTATRTGRAVTRLMPKYAMNEGIEIFSASATSLIKRLGALPIYVPSPHEAAPALMA